jgi:hypothetical protein
MGGVCENIGGVWGYSRDWGRGKTRIIQSVRGVIRVGIITKRGHGVMEGNIGK